MSPTQIRGAVYRNSYRDSVELMGIAAELERIPGVARAGLVMGTPANRAVLEGAGLANAAAADAGPNDLVVAIAADSAAAGDAALARAGVLLSGTREGPTAEGGERPEAPHTLAEGAAALPGANLALVSTPGAYATAETLKALKRGLNVFLFSDNVSVGDEVELKTLARQKGLLVMGPDCGTAIVGGVPLGFANAVRRGSIGLVGASGTGLQQVSCLIHRFGAGVTHALGTGGRDLDERVGGATMLAAIDVLLGDPQTRVLVVVSKPPSPQVALAVLDKLRGSAKPVVVCFLGGDPAQVREAGGRPAATFEEAASIAAALARGQEPPAEKTGLDPETEAAAMAAARALIPGQTAVLGLYTGGSLAGEAKLVLRQALGPDRHDHIVDLGDDEFTVGRPHPMIDPRLRNEKIVAAAADPEVGILLLDVVLGYGSHPDPAGAVAPAIREAKAVAAAAGRGLAIVASVCGTDEDFQGFEGQCRTLASAGVIVAASNSRAAAIAARIATVAAAESTRADPGPSNRTEAPA